MRNSNRQHAIECEDELMPISPGTPHLTLQMTGRAELSLTQSYRIEFAIRRSENDGVDLPCVVDWSAYSEIVRPPGLVLLCHNAAGGFDPVPVDLPRNLTTSERDDGFVVKGWEGSLCQLEPGAEEVRGVQLPECYYKAMRAGETYTLLYPGHEILMWDWGTLKELTGREIKKRAPNTTTADGSSPPNPVTPGGPAITFKAVEEDPPWPDRAARLAKIGFDSANWEESQWRWKLMRKREGSPPPMREAERS